MAITAKAHKWPESRRADLRFPASQPRPYPPPTGIGTWINRIGLTESAILNQGRLVTRSVSLGEFQLACLMRAAPLDEPTRIMQERGEHCQRQHHQRYLLRVL